MTDPVLSAPVPDISDYTDFTSLNRLKQGASNGNQDALKQAAAQFEAIFIQMLLKEMHNTQIDGGIFDSSQMKFYQDIQDKQLSGYLAKNGGLGMADVIVRQLSKDQSQATSVDQIKLTVTSNIQSSSNPVLKSDLPGDIHTQQEFVQTLLPIANKVSNETGFPPEILMTQAALETGWGSNMIRYPGGANSHNLFGIKADNRWDGHIVYSMTHEYVDGASITKSDKFRAYASYEASMKDYVDFIRNSPRYQSAMKYLDDPERYFQKIHNAGYATDPQYSHKLQMLLGTDMLSQSVRPFKNMDSAPLS